MTLADLRLVAGLPDHMHTEIRRLYVFRAEKRGGDELVASVRGRVFELSEEWSGHSLLSDAPRSRFRGIEAHHLSRVQATGSLLAIRISLLTEREAGQAAISPFPPLNRASCRYLLNSTVFVRKMCQIPTVFGGIM